MITIYATTQFEFFHCWPQAPEEVFFLRNRHRHIIHVKATKAVTHTDRDLEFILFKRELESFVKARWQGGPDYTPSASCEDIGLSILRKFRCEEVEVSEDGENGAIVKAFTRKSTDELHGPSDAFTGLEAEGPHIGARTLFLGRNADWRASDKHYRFMLENRIEQIYFGAGSYPVTRYDIGKIVDLLAGLEKRYRMSNLPAPRICVEAYSGEMDRLVLPDFYQDRILIALFQNTLDELLFSIAQGVCNNGTQFDGYYKTVDSESESIHWISSKCLGTIPSVATFWTRDPFFATDKPVILKN